MAVLAPTIAHANLNAAIAGQFSKTRVELARNQ